MTQLHQAASDEEVRSVRDALFSGVGGESPFVVTNAVGGRAPDRAGGAPSEKGRVLLLDDDPELREIIRDFLAANGYTVVAVQNGGEGVREVLGGDFVLVLCDFIMPGLTGDMFFRAVERIRPALCQRFVFMSGHQNDAATMEFITKVDAIVLWKPFPLTKLLASIAGAEARAMFRSVYEGAPAGGGLPEGCKTAGASQAGRTLLSEETELAEKVAGILARGQMATPGSTPSKKATVLLVESDIPLRGSIQACLAKSGFPVEVVNDAGEALRKVTGNDYGFILYDPEMPGMPKTQFYHAVKRLDPELCERFLFLLGEFTDANTSRFIRKVDGFVFRKPFFPFDLLNELLSAEKLGTLQGVFKRASADPVLSQLSPLEYDFPAGEMPAPQPSIGQHGGEPGLPANGGFPWSLAAGLALSFALIAGLWMQYGNARDRAGVAAADRVALETEWAAVSPDLEEALALRSKAALAQNELDRLSAARGELHWAPVLRCFLPPGDARIQILEINTHGESKDPGACEVVVKGVAEGTEPRMMADRFRQTVEEELRGIANGRLVSVHLDQLDVTPTTSPDETRASFVLIATVGTSAPPVAVSKEGQ